MIFRTVLHDVFVFQFGFHYQVAGYDVYMGEVLLAITALCLFAWLSIKGVSITGIFQTILVISLVSGICIVGLAALINTQVSWSNFSPGYPPNITGQFASILAILAISPWAFVGFDTIPQAAEEFNFSPKKSLSIMVVSILFGAAAYIALNMITISILPNGFENWVDYINASKKSTGLITLPTFYSTFLLLGNIGLAFLSISVIAAILSGLLGFYMATSRLLFAMARDDVIPKVFSELHTKYKTPRNAILFILTISLIAPFIGRTVLGWIVDMSSLGAAIGYAYTSAVAFKYAKENKNTIVMITGFIGFICAVCFAIVLLVPIPSLNISLGRESYLFLLIWTVMGYYFYTQTFDK